MSIVVVTGASGSGKTEAVMRLEARGLVWLRCFYFDRIGIPTPAAMERVGGPERWQADATRRWLEELAAEADQESVRLLEGQTRPSFVYDAAAALGAEDTAVVLFDCSPPVREERLVRRGHPELAAARTEAWAAYLRDEATAFAVPIIDTTHLSIVAAADALEEVIRARQRRRLWRVCR